VSSDEFVCGECFGDQGLKDFCLNHVESRECDFCGATDSEPIAAPLDEVIEHINSCIHRYFDDPANAGLAYESAEGGWQGTTYYTYEVFNELDLDFPKDKDSRLYNAISEGVDNYLWSEVDPYGLSLDQQLHFSWEQFCHVIKHERRYFFLQEKKEAAFTTMTSFSPRQKLSGRSSPSPRRSPPLLRCRPARGFTAHVVSRPTEPIRRQAR
jgi:hypothetical protein